MSKHRTEIQWEVRCLISILPDSSSVSVALAYGFAFPFYHECLSIGAEMCASVAEWVSSWQRWCGWAAASDYK